MKNLLVKIKILLVIAFAGLFTASFAPSVGAIPFGEGKFNVGQFGSPTSLSVALSGNVNLNLTANGNQFTATGSHTVTVTTSDVYGYSLYAYTPSSSTMTGGSGSIPASANSSAAPLALNTWGYNTDGSANYLGLTTTPAIIKVAASGPYASGDVTTVTYGVLADITKPAGAYTVSIVYTAAVPIQ